MDEDTVPLQHVNVQHPASSDPDANYPRIGDTRCYWCLLSAHLNFVYLCPTMAYHLEDQANSILGKSLIDFLHPEEQAAARSDLNRVVEQRSLNGSVTRVRIARLSSVRHQLGFKGTVPLKQIYEAVFPDAKRVVYDENWMTVEIVLNWAGDHPDFGQYGGGFLLCFMHATIDASPVQGEDTSEMPLGWTNQCSTPLFPPTEIDNLSRRLGADAPPFNGAFQPQSGPLRHFQIINNAPQRNTLFSWPPSTSYDGELQHLAQTVYLDSGRHARTRCQQRYRNSATLRSGKPVDSVFTPHGSIIFACHVIDIDDDLDDTPDAEGMTDDEADFYPVGPSTGLGGRPFSTQEMGLLPPIFSRYPDSSVRSSSGTDLQPSGSTNSLPPIATLVAESVELRSRDGSSITSSPPRSGYFPSPSRGKRITHDKRSSSIVVSDGVLQCSNCGVRESPEWRMGPSGNKDLCNACGLRYARALAKKEGPSSVRRSRKLPSDDGSSQTEGSSLLIPENARSRAARNKLNPQNKSAGSKSPSVSGKPTYPPPPGISGCATCGSTESPEWRKGPSGLKDLCNACGLRFARSSVRRYARDGAS